MNLIALINSELLYAKALTEQVPYFKFASWIESTVQKEVIAQLFKSKMNSKSAIPTDLITGSEEKKKAKQKQRTATQKDQMKNQLIAFLNNKKQDAQPSGSQQWPSQGTEEAKRPLQKAKT